MRFRVAFGLFGWSENSSFPSTLRAWFAFAHSSPPTGMTKEAVAPHPSSPPYPSPSWGGYLANPLPKLRGNRQNAPSPDWERLEWRVSRKGFIFFRHSEQRSKAERDSESPALGRFKDYSVPHNVSNYATLNRVQGDRSTV